MPFLQKRIGSTSVGNFGETLSELRRLRGYSEDELSRATGIHVSIIRALEEERLEELIDPMYAERHVRTLVTVLEGRPAYFLEKYRDLLAARNIGSEPEILLRPRVRRRDLFVGSRAVAFVGFLFLVAAIGGYVIWQAQLAASVPKLEVTFPPDGLLVDEPRMNIEGQTDPAALVTVNGRQAVVDSTGRFQLRFEIPRGLTILRIEARRRFGSAAVSERRVIYERQAPTSSATSVVP